tara:strand:+ start:3142 stop:4179 length:1038 start_codon:yes stop_codon:yes gene_type:complete
MNRYLSKLYNLSNFTKLGGLVTGGVIGQLMMENPTKDFYERKFVTNKNPQDLSEFYGGDKLMHIFCVFPFVVKLLMESGYWDEDGTYNTYGIPFGKMRATIDFEEKERDTTGDGENDDLCGFNKRERFHDILFGYTLWDQVTNFGFNKLPDGRCECYQKGEYYYGMWPMKWVFQLHSYYVNWAVKKHIEQESFGDSEEDEVFVQEKEISLDVFVDFLEGLKLDLQNKFESKLEILEDINKLIIKLNNLYKEKNIFESNKKFNEVVKVYVRKVGKTHNKYDTELSVIINDCEIKEIVITAINLVNDNEPRPWSLRSLTPTWIDGNKLDCKSNAWTSLITSLLNKNI